MLSTDVGQRCPSVPASSIPASPSPMAVGSHRGHPLCPDPLAAVPGADPNPRILAAGPRPAVSLHRRSPFTHLLAITGAATLRTQLF